ncbi:MAG: hypothetical protein ACOZE5_04065 [Verrucomicrobiota bacterium]
MQPQFDAHWILLVVQAAVLGGLILREFAKVRGRNLYVILVATAMLVLVQGQAWWVFAQFDRTGYDHIKIAYNAFGIESAKRANFYLTLATLCFAGCLLLADGIRWKKVRDVSWLKIRPQYSPFTYFLVGLWMTLATASLITRVGGIEVALTKPGQMVGGQTVWLLAVGLGKWPLIEKLTNRRPVSSLDVLFYGWALLVTLFNSRFLTAFAVLQLIVAINYCRKEVSRKTIMALTFPALAIFILFGIYRHIAHRIDVDAVDSVAHEVAADSRDFAVVDWFYGLNVEAFTGVAGVIDYEQKQGGLAHDYGISELAILTNYIPNHLRTNPDLVFYKWAQALKDAYPYTASVVPSGFELSYGHFGLAGMIVYAAILAMSTKAMHLWARARGGVQALGVLLGIQLLNGVRASLFGAMMFFGLADLVTFSIYRLLCLRTGRAAVAGPAPAMVS